VSFNFPSCTADSQNETIDCFITQNVEAFQFKTNLVNKIIIKIVDGYLLMATKKQDQDETAILLYLG